MKKSIAIAGLFAFLTTPAFASFSSEELQAATSLAIADFESGNLDHASHMTGFKTWKSGHDAKVKIYVSHQGTNVEFNYVCHKHGDQLECHAN